MSSDGLDEGMSWSWESAGEEELLISVRADHDEQMTASLPVFSIELFDRRETQKFLNSIHS